MWDSRYTLPVIAMQKPTRQPVAVTVRIRVIERVSENVRLVPVFVTHGCRVYQQGWVREDAKAA